MNHAEVMFIEFMTKRKQNGIKYIKKNSDKSKEYGIKNIFIDSAIEKNF